MRPLTSLPSVASDDARQAAHFMPSPIDSCFSLLMEPGKCFMYKHLTLNLLESGSFCYALSDSVVPINTELAGIVSEETEYTIHQALSPAGEQSPSRPLPIAGTGARENSVRLWQAL